MARSVARRAAAHPPGSRCVVLALCLGASAAQAWEVSVQILSESSIQGSTATSEASTRAENAERREERREERRRSKPKSHGGLGAVEGSQCSNDDECGGWCRDFRCVDTQPVVAPVNHCETDQGCAPGWICADFRCVVPPGCADDQACGPGRFCRDRQCFEAQPPIVPMNACASDAQCQPGQSCANGQCLSPPPPPPSSSLFRRGSEVYLRDRAAQLRQDLALGEGPVISTLASVRGVSAAGLGRLLRQHRAELIALMGSDDGWAGRFLLKLDQLSPAPPQRGTGSG